MTKQYLHLEMVRILIVYGNLLVSLLLPVDDLQSNHKVEKNKNLTVGETQTHHSISIGEGVYTNIQCFEYIALGNKNIICL